MIAVTVERSVTDDTDLLRRSLHFLRLMVTIESDKSWIIPAIGSL